jgi:nucleotide-binding universal stress UspA family protein
MKYFQNKTIVIPCDFSEPAMDAVNEALALAEDSTSIHVVHVVDPTPVMISVDPALPIPASYDHGRFQEAQQQMKQMFEKGDYARLKIHCSIGDPGAEIADYATSVRANMIIMPSHGRSGLGRLLMGSVAERVLRLADCPVLILRKPKK